jgi:hypothetical protein
MNPVRAFFLEREVKNSCLVIPEGGKGSVVMKIIKMLVLKIHFGSGQQKI